MLASRRTRRSISSKVRISSRSSHGSPSAGMQYWQRKLQRSVTETRRSEISRPWPSRRGSSFAIPSSLASSLELESAGGEILRDGMNLAQNGGGRQGKFARATARAEAEGAAA